MKFGIGAYVLLSGVAVASYGAAVDNRAFVAAFQDEPHLLERRALGFLQNIKLPQIFQPKTTAAATAAAAKATAPGSPLSQLVAKGVNYDVKAIIESVKNAARAVDIPVILKKYAIPLSLAALKELQKFSGERLLNQIASIKGKEVLDYARKFNTGLIWEAYNDFKVGPVLNTIFGQDMSPFIAQLQKLSGADIVKFLQGLTGAQLASIVAGGLQLFKITPILEALGMDVKPLLQVLSGISGAKLMKYVEDFDGAQMLKWFATLDGQAIADLINQYANIFLSQVRQIASQMLGGTPPPVYNDFDLLRIIDATQALVEGLTGLKFPSVSADIKSFNGGAYLEQIKQLDFTFLVEIGLIAQEAALIAAKEALKYASGTVGRATGAASALGRVWNKVLSDLRAFNGDKFLQIIKNLNAKAIVKTIKDLGAVQVIRVLTTADLTPYLDAFANFNGATFLTNVESMSKETFAKYTRDVGLSQYLGGFTGIPANEVVQALENIDGARILKEIRLLNGKDVFDLFAAIAGSKELSGK